jgi:hypothetical protein
MNCRPDSVAICAFIAFSSLRASCAAIVTAA